MTDRTHPDSGRISNPGAAIQRYKIGYHSDEWGQRSSTPSGIPDAAGSWVRYADHLAALAAEQATAGAALPAGWVPLTITHEGQHPEEVAYGPKIMMDRLGKWLGKFFAYVATPTAQDSMQEDAIADSQYLAGVTAGFNAAQATDPNAALRKIHESRQPAHSGEPTPEELDELLLSHGMLDQWPTQKQGHAFARAVLARWGQPAHSGEPVECDCRNPYSHDECTQQAGCKIKTKLSRKTPSRSAGAAIEKWGQPAHSGEPVGYEFRWLNPANNSVQDDALEWKRVKPERHSTIEIKLRDLKNYRYDGKPVYEVRALYTSPQPVEREPLTPEQIEALPVWKRFVGLWPESRCEIVRNIESAHGITQKGGQHDS